MDPKSYEDKVIPPVSSGSSVVVNSQPPSNGSLIEDIEATADYHLPSVYHLLTFYSSYKPETDSNNSFVPVSQTKPNPKLFVVGVLPPSVNITGRLLDRSASLGSVGSSDDVTGAPYFMDEPEGRDVAVGVQDNVAIPSGNGTKGADLPDSFWQKFVMMCDRLQVDPYELAAVIEKESRFNPGAQNLGPKGQQRATPIAQGLCQFTRKTATSGRIGMDEETWNNFCLLSAEEQLPYVEKFYMGRAAGKSKEDLNIITFGGYNNPDGSLYASKEAQAAWIAAHPEDAGKFKNPEKQDLAVKQNPRASKDGGLTIRREGLAENLAPYPSGAVKSRIAAAQAYLQRFYPTISVTQTVEPGNSDWYGDGMANAAAAKKEQAKTSELRNEARAELGRRYLDAQRAEIMETIQAIEALRNAPPLRLLVNPSTFTINSEKIVSDGNWTRNGPIVEHWGDNQDKIDASGKIAAFFAIDSNSPNPESQGEGPGLTRGARQYSASYQNFLSLYMLYRNNAKVHTSGLPSDSSKGNFLARLSMVGSMYIFYDDTLYLGSFDNFTITESDTSPYTLEYSFQFTARATFLLDRPAMYTPEAASFIRKMEGVSPIPTTTSQRGIEDFSEVPLPSGVTE